MKYCLSAKQPLIIREKADELFLEWKDKDGLYDLINENPNVKINLQIPEEDINLKQLQTYVDNITLVISDIKKVKTYESYGFKYYWKYPITTFAELHYLDKLGVCQFLIGEPLYFDLEPIARLDKPIRLIANLAYDNFIPRDNGVRGTYVRPEDVIFYEKYVSVLEFYSESLKQEETLFKIYKEDHKWPGNLNKIIANLKYDVDNRGLPKEFGTARMQCRQNCMRSGTCNFCETSFIFSRKLDEANESDWIKSE